MYNEAKDQNLYLSIQLTNANNGIFFFTFDGISTSIVRSRKIKNCLQVGSYLRGYAD